MTVRRLGILCCGVAALVAGGPAARSQLPVAAAPRLPDDLVGAWQVQIAGRAYKLRADYTIEIKIGGGGARAPIALVAYFAGDQQRPTSICRTQLALLESEGQGAVFGESLNYRAGKDPCPIWDQVSVAPRGDGLWVQWRDAVGRKTVVKMEGGATRSSGGAECRLVASDGQTYCRTPDGNWLPKAR